MRLKEVESALALLLSRPDVCIFTGVFGDLGRPADSNG